MHRHADNEFPEDRDEVSVAGPRSRHLPVEGEGLGEAGAGPQELAPASHSPNHRDRRPGLAKLWTGCYKPVGPPPAEKPQEPTTNGYDGWPGAWPIGFLRPVTERDEGHLDGKDTWSSRSVGRPRAGTLFVPEDEREQDRISRRAEQWLRENDPDYENRQHPQDGIPRLEPEVRSKSELAAMMESNRGLGKESGPNYGRTKTHYVGSEGAPIVDSLEMGQAVERDFLATGGWHPDNAGTTGLPVGRPAKGIRDPERIGEKMRRLLDHPDVFPAHVYAAFDFHDPNGNRKKHQLVDLRDLWSAVAKEDGVNVHALSEVTGVEQRQINKRAKRGLEKRTPNAHKGGQDMTTEAAVIAAYEKMRQRGVGYHGPHEEENDVTNTAVIEAIKAEGEKTREAIERAQHETMLLLYAFERDGETPASEWGRYLAERQESTPTTEGTARTQESDEAVPV